MAFQIATLETTELSATPLLEQKHPLTNDSYIEAIGRSTGQGLFLVEVELVDKLACTGVATALGCDENQYALKYKTKRLSTREILKLARGENLCT